MEIVFFILRMNLIIKLFCRRFDSQQITVSAGFKPAAVGLFCLFAQRQCDSEASVVDFLYFLDEIFYFIDKFLIVAFTALDGDGAIAQLMSQTGAFEHFVVAQGVTLNLGVFASHAAVEAIFSAAVAIFDESAQMDIVVEIFQFGFQCLVEKTRHLLAFCGKENFQFVFCKIVFIKNLFESWHLNLNFQNYISPSNLPL